MAKVEFRKVKRTQPRHKVETHILSPKTEAEYRTKLEDKSKEGLIDVVIHIVNQKRKLKEHLNLYLTF